MIARAHPVGPRACSCVRAAKTEPEDTAVGCAGTAGDLLHWPEAVSPSWWQLRDCVFAKLGTWTVEHLTHYLHIPDFKISSPWEGRGEAAELWWLRRAGPRGPALGDGGEGLLQTSLALGAGKGHTLVLHVLRSCCPCSKPGTASVRRALAPAPPPPSPKSAKSHLLRQLGSGSREDPPRADRPRLPGAPIHSTHPRPPGLLGEGTCPGLAGPQRPACWGGAGLQDTLRYFKERHVPIPGLQSPLWQLRGGAEGPASPAPRAQSGAQPGVNGAWSPH